MRIQIKQGALADEPVKDIIEFARMTKDGIHLAEQDFEAKRKIIERLDTRVTLVVENDQRVIYAQSIVSKKHLPIEYQKRSFVQ